MASSDAGAHIRRRAAGGMWTLALVLVVMALPLQAQRSRAVTLRINPRAGDTLYTRFEQTVEMSGTTHVGSTDTTMTMKSTLLLLSHLIVNSSDSSGATITAVTDSVALDSWRMGKQVPSETARRAMEGKRIQLQIAPNGSATVVDAPDELTSDVRAAVSAMPSTLPDRPMKVGSAWKQTTAIPVSASTGGGQGASGRAATLTASYRLDSLSRDGNIAFISMRGVLQRDSTAAPLSRGLRVISNGTITGSLRVDRKRGWWTSSDATITLESVLTPSSDSSGSHPMRVLTRIEQKMHTGEGW
ncbi:MAG TPA: hypothetical protein VFK39_07405 [Gemmatimonadaceae bacterium]|nr:hypothetical protein [Gemmatimonadaceae bacterium]